MDFNHTAAQARAYRQAILSSIDQVINSGIFLHGPQSQSLEKNLSRFFNQPYVMTLSSGHDAVQLAVMSLKLEPQDEVIFQVNAYPTAFPVTMAGCIPVPVDVDENGQLSYQSLLKHLSPHTKAIVITHMYGAVGDLQPILKIAKKNKLKVIEDCAHALGTTWQHKLVGTLGEVGCFSFYPTKNLGTLGDGGAMITARAKIYQYVTQAKTYGESDRYRSNFIAGHSRISELQAAVLNIYWRQYRQVIRQRRQVYRWYQQALETASLTSSVRLLASAPDSQPVTHLLVAAVKDRDQLQKFLALKKIPTAIHYPHPIYSVPAFAHYHWQTTDFPTAKKLSRSLLSLPFHQYLTRDEVNHVVKNLALFYQT